MFAVIKAGGHQYRVAPGEVLKVDRMAGEPGAPVVFDKILMVGEGDKITVGKPVVENAKVTATIESQERDPKVIIFKYKRRKNYKRKRGHKQPVTMLKINEIQA